MTSCGMRLMCSVLPVNNKLKRSLTRFSITVTKQRNAHHMASTSRGGSASLTSRGAAALNEMDRSLQQLQSQLGVASKVSSSNVAPHSKRPTPPPSPPTLSGPAIHSSTESIRMRPTKIAPAATHSTEMASPSTEGASDAAVALSAKAAEIVKNIHDFDLFAAVRSSSAKLSVVERKPASGISCSSAVGGDEPIPVDAPQMSDAVMSGTIAAADETPGSRVLRRPTSAGGYAWRNSSAAFLSSLSRAIASVYFEELRYQVEKHQETTTQE